MSAKMKTIETKNEATDSLTNTIQKVDGQEIQVMETEDPRLYEVTNLTKARQAREERGFDMGTALDEYTYHTLVSHQRELVLETDDPESMEKLQNPTAEHENESTGSVYDIAVSRYLGYEMLTYDINQKDIQNLKLLKEHVGQIGWREVTFLKMVKQEAGNVVAAAKRLGLNTDYLI